MASEAKRTRGVVGDGYLDPGSDDLAFSFRGENTPVVVTVDEGGAETDDVRLSIEWPNVGADVYADLAPAEVDALIARLQEVRACG